MKILFLTLVDFSSFSDHNIYCDLLREFMRRGHEVYCVSPSERHCGIETHFEENGHLLKLKIGNTQKTSIIEKGISTVLIGPQCKAAVRKYFGGVCFDLILYSTPPITLLDTVRFVKKRDYAQTYLLLKDIFPQNAVDLGMMQKRGIRAPLYWYFRSREKQLYAISDHIGCMSKANVDYIVRHNPQIDPTTVEICPNSIETMDCSVTKPEALKIREKYGIPADKKVFVYGGNLGKAQGIPFLIDCLRAEKDNREVFFLLVGNGTEFCKLEEFIQNEHPSNVLLMKRLPKEDYDRMIGACDAGMIFLDYRFTIPNFPSRLLSYMQAGIPVLVCSDANTDVGDVVEEGGFGWQCRSNSVVDFSVKLKTAMQSEMKEMGKNGYRILCRDYSAAESCRIICHSFSNDELKK